MFADPDPLREIQDRLNILTSECCSIYNPRLADSFASSIRQSSFFNHALINAVIKGDLEQIRSLANNGANVNEATEEDGITALMVAVVSKLSENVENIGAMRLLLELGANIGFTNNHGYTAYMHTLEYNLVNSLRLLREYDSDPNPIVQVRDMLTFRLLEATTLIFASSEGHLEMVQFLVDELNMDVNARIENGLTALMEARSGGHLEVAHFLESKGAAELTQEDYQTITTNN